MARDHLSGATNDRMDTGGTFNPAGDFTICAWITKDTADEESFARVIANRSTGNVGWYMGNGTGGTAHVNRFHVSIGGTFRQADGSTTINDGNWHFTAGRYTSGATDTVELFVDDMTTPDASTSGTFGAYDTTTENLIIGNRPTSFGRKWPGYIANVGLFYRALTTGELEMAKVGLYAQLRPELWYWGGLGGNAGPEPDLSGNGNNGTITGTLDVIDHAPVVMPFSFPSPASRVITVSTAPPPPSLYGLGGGLQELNGGLQ